MRETIDAARLMSWTEQYYTFGVHRTGLAPDLATAAWFFEILETMGARCERRQVVFDRYDVSASLTDTSGEPIACEPVFYEFLGKIDTTDFEVIEIGTAQVGLAAGLDSVLNPGGTLPRVLVIESPEGMVRAPNRRVAACDRVAAVVVGESDLLRLEGARLNVDAQLVPGLCEASSAVLGPDGAPPVTITTPLSGWFGCASERGTGVAVALALAERLAAQHRVTVVACSGHELDHLGLHVWIEEAEQMGLLPEGPVIHLGASVAALDPTDDGETKMAPRLMLHHLDGLDLADVAEPAGFRVICTSEAWPGEGGTWREHVVSPVLSFVGGGQWFHTTGDTPEAATSVEALEASARAVFEATDRFLSEVEHNG
ncbi:MAG: hypothetical protein GY925_11915 [Actinomycetia bacterium]|nr:hypothetical protein [Actinomycetes bacterium]